jgi:acyl-lipid omega-6 desaturase (Delta-12 desaturase)
MNRTTDQNTKDDRSWEKIIMNYNRPDMRKSIWQILNTLVPYVGMWFLMAMSLQYSYWYTLLLSFPAAGLLIRLFIIFHDCGHGSFFRSKTANEIVGMIFGIVTFTPFYKWHQQHRVHHATSGNLDKRGIGDIWTLTVEEYLNSSVWRRFFYRAFRNPFFLFTFGPAYVILVQNRITTHEMTRQEKWNVYFTNSMILCMAASISLLIGIKAYLLIQLPVIIIAHVIGLWLFYIQHQFDGVSWERNDHWDYKTAAINGSSFLKLPVIFQWFTGNIGFHHVHHLSSKIPNYNLARCHYDHDLFNKIKPVDVFATFKALKLSLWDESSRSMISFRKLAINI